MLSGPLRAFDCRNTANPPLVPSANGAPPCVEQGPWTFRGARRYYPHVEREAP
jgi:hypothetical protein